MAPGFSYRGFGGAFVVAQVDEGGLDVAPDAGGRGRSGPFCFDGDGFELVFQFDNHALGGFAADTRNFGEAREIAGANGGNQLFDVHAGKNFQGERGADAGSAEEKFEKMLFALGEKTVEGECIFADMRVNQQGDFGVKFAKRRESGERNGDEIADTANIEYHLVGTFFEKTAAEESDHRMKVLLV